MAEPVSEPVTEPVSEPVTEPVTGALTEGTEPVPEADGEATAPSEAGLGGAPGSADARHWAAVAAAAAASKTDEDTVVLEVAPVMAIVEYFVITAGRNPRQVRTLADEIEEQVARAGGPKPKRIEGRDALQWLLMDYGDFVVHVFHEEMRAFYALEKLWADVPRLDWRAESATDATSAVDQSDKRT